MTLFIQKYIPAHVPGRKDRAPYWSAWVDPAGRGLSALGRTKAEALGNLLVVLMDADHLPEELEIRTQPAADFRTPKGAVARAATSAEGGVA